MELIFVVSIDHERIRLVYVEAVIMLDIVWCSGVMQMSKDRACEWSKCPTVFCSGARSDFTISIRR